MGVPLARVYRGNTLESFHNGSIAVVDSNGRLRKLTYHTDLDKVAAAAGQAGVTGTLTETMELYDYGVPVNVRHQVVLNINGVIRLRVDCGRQRKRSNEDSQSGKTHDTNDSNATPNQRLRSKTR